MQKQSYDLTLLTSHLYIDEFPESINMNGTKGCTFTICGKDVVIHTAGEVI